MHLHEVQQYLIVALERGAITRRQYMKYSGSLDDVDELMRRLPFTDKSKVFALYPFEPPVLCE